MRVCGVTDRRCYVVLLLSVPVLQTIGLGTVEPLLVLALALAWRYRDRNWLGSAALGVAIAAKLFLWPVLLWLLLTGRIRRTAETVAAGAAALLLPWAMLGFHGLTWYPRMLRLLVQTEHATSWALPSKALPIALAVAIVAIFAASRSTGEGDRKAFTVAVVACLLLSPLVWLHYYVIWSCRSRSQADGSACYGSFPPSPSGRSPGATTTSPSRHGDSQGSQPSRR
jgi:hypothetical protein